MQTRLLFPAKGSALAGVGAVCALSLGGPCVAQDRMAAQGAPAAQSAPRGDAGAAAVAELTEIVVTGSRIPRNDLAANSPVTTLGAERFQVAADSNVVEQLQMLPAFTPGRSPTGGQDVTFAGSYADLRGLDRKRTLVLVDGRRWINTISDGGVDLSTVPPELIERVDVMTGGASATYGSDAVAGVINFILKRDFSGIELSAQSGMTDRGEGTNTRAALTGGLGLGEGRGSAYVHMSYDETDRIDGDGRSFADPTLFNDGGRFVPLRSDVITSGSALVDTGSGARRAFFNSSGELFSAPGVINAVSDAHLFSLGEYARVQIPAKKQSIAAGFDYELSDSATLYADAIYIHDDVEVWNAPSAVSLDGASVSLDNPYLGPLTRAYLTTLDADADGVVALDGWSRRMSELGSEIRQNDRNSYRFLTGVDVQLGDWTWDTSIIFTESTNAIQFRGFVNSARLQQALDAVAGSTGPVCRDPSFNCQPINLFGAGSIGAQAAAFVSSGGRLNARNTDTVAQSVVTGTLLELPAGPLGVSFGAEYKKSRASEIPDDDLLFGLSGRQFARMSGSLEQVEEFAEINVPLLRAVPFVHALGIELGARHSSFTPGDEAWTYKALIDWAPLQRVKLRGGMQQATRAPNIYELAAGDKGIFPIALLGDPCFTGAPLTGDLRAACIATGVPAAVADSGAALPGAELFEYTAFGNPGLEPEDARTYTIGLVLRDLPVTGLSFTVDYYDINIEDTVGNFGPFNIFNQCYASGTGGASALCAQIGRNPVTGALAQFRDNFNNVGELNVRGLDIGAGYQIPTRGWMGAHAQLSVDLVATHLLEFTTVPFAAEPDLDYDCAGLYGGQCGEPQPEWKANTRLAWRDGPLTLALTWSWIGSVDDDATQFNPSLVPELVRTSIGSRNYFDLAATFDVTPWVQLRAGIENLLDEEPPIVGVDRSGIAGDTNSFPGQYDHIGRRYFGGVRVRF